LSHEPKSRAGKKVDDRRKTTHCGYLSPERICGSLPPGQIVPILADKGTYIASESSFYRVLHQADEQHHRGRSRKPQSFNPPQGYCATCVNQMWSWDLTWLPTPIRGMFFYLDMLMDVYSRKIVGWEVRPMESAELSAALVHKAVLSQGCLLDQPA
jgi:putative transposase